jgi:hypothetical protein
MGSQAFAAPSPWQEEGGGEGTRRRRPFPLTQTLSPSGGEGDQGDGPHRSRKNLPKKARRERGYSLRLC